MKVAWTKTVRDNVLFTAEDLTKMPPLVPDEHSVLFPFNDVKVDDANVKAHYAQWADRLRVLHSIITAQMDGDEEHIELFERIYTMVQISDNNDVLNLPSGYGLSNEPDDESESGSKRYAELVFAPNYAAALKKGSNRHQIAYTSDLSASGVIFFDSVLQIAMQYCRESLDQEELILGDRDSGILLMKFATTSFDLSDELAQYHHVARECYTALMDFTRRVSTIVIQEHIPNSHNLPRCAKPSIIAVPTCSDYEYTTQDPSLVARLANNIDILRSYPQVKSVLVDVGETVLDAMFRSIFLRFSE